MGAAAYSSALLGSESDRRPCPNLQFAPDETSEQPTIAVSSTTGSVTAADAVGSIAHVTGRTAPILQIASSLLWLPQAGLLSLAVGGIAANAGIRNAFWSATGVLALGLVRAVLDAAGSRLAFREARGVLSEKRGTAVSSLAARSPIDSERPASGMAASVLAELAEAIVPYLARFRVARMRAMIIPVAIFACVLPFSWAAALVLMLAAPLIPLFMALIGWRAKAASEAQLVEVGGMNAFLLDRLRGIATIRALHAVDTTARRLRADAESLRDRTMTVLRIAFLSSAVLELFAALGVAMVAVYVGFHLLGQLEFGSWGRRLSLGEGLFILLLAPAFFEPLRELSSVWHDRAAGETAFDALEQLACDGIGLLGACAQRNRLHHRTAPGGASVRIEGLRYRHTANEVPVFDGIDLDVAPGEHVALLAPSGGGKSTLLALIAGLAPFEGGRILIDGTPLTAETAATLRTNMTWFGQQPHIFAGTLATNVSLGRPDAGPKAVREAFRVAAFQDVARAYGGAPVGEGGAGLSGGEALRLALARAAANPKAELILADEPTAHLDAATAREIENSLLAFAAGRTLIVSTHDPVLAARMDRTVRLETLMGEGRA